MVALPGMVILFALTIKNIMSVGIYFIEINSLYYIGQSVNIEKRFSEHKRLLNLNKHNNYKVQKEYNKRITFSMGILETCLSSELDALEVIYITEFNSIEDGLNLMQGGDAARGVQASNSKHTREQLIESLLLLADPNNKMVDISNITGVSRATLCHITKGKAHVWLMEEFPEIYDKVQIALRKRPTISATKAPKWFTVVPFKVENKTLGIVEEITVIKDFARKYGVSPSNISSMKTGRANSVKGWTMFKETT